jgi:hypothetical protein
MNFAEYKLVIEDFNATVTDWLKANKLQGLPEYHKLQDKETLGVCYRHDQIYYEQLTEYKSTYFALSAFLTNQLLEADRETKRNIETLIDTINIKVKALDTKIEAGKKRLDFYKTIVYLIGNVIYGAD